MEQTLIGKETIMTSHEDRLQRFHELRSTIRRDDSILVLVPTNNETEQRGYFQFELTI
jgi:hypothetical protein